jgi:hypothetical protein
MTTISKKNVGGQFEKDEECRCTGPALLMNDRPKIQSRETNHVKDTVSPGAQASPEAQVSVKTKG